MSEDDSLKAGAFKPGTKIWAGSDRLIDLQNCISLGAWSAGTKDLKSLHCKAAGGLLRPLGLVMCTSHCLALPPKGVGRLAKLEAREGQAGANGHLTLYLSLTLAEF